jgi:hypothetical protein
MYIVWREPFKNSFSETQGDGYFVSYRDKCSDNYSKNWYDAKKYKTIGIALSRLGISCPKYLRSLEHFFKINNIDPKTYNRDKVLSDILNTKKEVSFYFLGGRIDKIDGNGIISRADEDILEYINKIINNNLKKKLKEKSVIGYETKYQEPKQTGVDTWEGFY